MFFHTVDGNFQSTQKLKPMDPTDFPLTTGAGYFADERDYDMYVKAIRPEKDVRRSQFPHPAQSLTVVKTIQYLPANSLERFTKKTG